MKRSQEFESFNLDDMLDSNVDEITLIPIEELHSFKDHPFRVNDDEEMELLVDSITKVGIINPIIVREDVENTYEIISGHRRTYAAKKAGLTEIPAYVRHFTQDEAVIYMVDSNLQREHLLPSEKAFAYKMKNDALKHQGKKGLDSDGTTREQLAKEGGDSTTQIWRYLNITRLIPELLDKVDNHTMSLDLGSSISALPEEKQEWICDYCDSYETTPSRKMQQVMGEESVDDRDSFFVKMEEETKEMEAHEEKKKKEKEKHFLPKKPSPLLVQYFDDKDYTVAEMEDVILNLLAGWKDSRR